MEYNNNSERKNFTRNKFSNITKFKKINHFYNQYNSNNNFTCEYDCDYNFSNDTQSSDGSENYETNNNDNDSNYNYDLHFNKLIKLKSLISEFENKIFFIKKINNKIDYIDDDKLNSIDTLVDKFIDDFELLLCKFNKNIISNGQIKINNPLEFEF